MGHKSDINEMILDDVSNDKIINLIHRKYNIKHTRNDINTFRKKIEVNCNYENKIIKILEKLSIPILIKDIEYYLNNDYGKILPRNSLFTILFDKMCKNKIVYYDQKEKTYSLASSRKNYFIQEDNNSDNITEEKNYSLDNEMNLKSEFKSYNEVLKHEIEILKKQSDNINSIESSVISKIIDSSISTVYISSIPTNNENNYLEKLCSIYLVFLENLLIVLEYFKNTDTDITRYTLNNYILSKKINIADFDVLNILTNHIEFAIRRETIRETIYYKGTDVRILNDFIDDVTNEIYIYKKYLQSISNEVNPTNDNTEELDSISLLEYLKKEISIIIYDLYNSIQFTQLNLLFENNLYKKENDILNFNLSDKNCYERLQNIVSHNFLFLKKHYNIIQNITNIIWYKNELIEHNENDISAVDLEHFITMFQELFEVDDEKVRIKNNYLFNQTKDEIEFLYEAYEKYLSILNNKKVAEDDENLYKEEDKIVGKKNEPIEIVEPEISITNTSHIKVEKSNVDTEIVKDSKIPISDNNSLNTDEPENITNKTINELLPLSLFYSYIPSKKHFRLNIANYQKRLELACSELNNNELKQIKKSILLIQNHLEDENDWELVYKKFKQGIEKQDVKYNINGELLSKYAQNPFKYFLLFIESTTENITFEENKRFQKILKEICRDNIVTEAERELVFEKASHFGINHDKVVMYLANEFRNYPSFIVLINEICEDGIVTIKERKFIEEKAKFYKVPLELLDKLISIGLFKVKKLQELKENIDFQDIVIIYLISICIELDNNFTLSITKFISKLNETDINENKSKLLNDFKNQILNKFCKILNDKLELCIFNIDVNTNIEVLLLKLGLNNLEFNFQATEKTSDINNYSNETIKTNSDSIKLDDLIEILNNEKYRLGNPAIEHYVENIKLKIKEHNEFNSTN